MKMLPTAIALPLLAFLAGAATPAQRSTRDGVYTDAQADEGARLYAIRCASCHGRALEGTYDIPGLGDRFIALWSNAPVANLHSYLGRAMPQFAPGSLKPEESSAIVAYLFRANALPAGPDRLAADPEQLKSIILEPAARN